MIGLFVTIFGSIAASVAIATFIAAEVMEWKRRQSAQDRIRRAVAAPRSEKKAPKRVKVLADQPQAGGVRAENIALFRALDKRIRTAGLTWNPVSTAGAMAGLTLAGALLGMAKPVLLVRSVSAIGLAAALGSLPYAYISRLRNKRLETFESQFPDALDFFSRAVRAGHAFSVSLELMASEAPEPIRTEFRRVAAEHQLGAPLDTALDGLMERVPLVDTRFFVSAVLLQRETGGNLSEMLENLAAVIRERFQLKGKVRAASAHGRMTAGALTVIPVVLLVLLTFTRPGYLKPMAEDHHGKIALLGALIGQISGYFVMKKIVNIKV